MIHLEVLLILIFGLHFEYRTIGTKIIDKKKKQYLLISLSICWIVAALRNIDWAASLHLDAAVYSWMYKRDIADIWSNILASAIERYIRHIGDYDIGYIAFSKLVGLLTDNYYIFSLIADLIFFIPFGKLLYRYTSRVRDIMFAVLFYIGMMQPLMIAGARQMYALGLNIFAFLFLIDNKKVKAIVLILLAITFHYSSIIMIIPFMMIYRKIKSERLKQIHLISLIFAPVFFLYSNRLIAFTGKLMGIERYANYGENAGKGGVTWFVIMLLLLSVVCYIGISKKFLEEDNSIHSIYKMLPFLTLLVPLNRTGGSMSRISLYFYVYLTVLVPCSVNRLFVRNSKGVVYAIMIGALFYLIFKSEMVSYKFMWQAMT